MAVEIEGQLARDECRHDRCRTFTSVSSGSSNTCARKTDGTLWCWGCNGYGEVGDGTPIDKSTPAQAQIGICP